MALVGVAPLAPCVRIETRRLVALQQNEALLEEDPWADLVNLDGLHIPINTLLDQNIWPLHDQPNYRDDYNSGADFGSEEFQAFPSATTGAVASDAETREFSADDASDGDAAAGSAVRPLSLSLFLGFRLHTNMLAGGSCRLCPLPQE